MNGPIASTAPTTLHRSPPSLTRVWRGIWRLTFGRFASRNHLLALLAIVVGLGLICTAFLDGRQGRAHYIDWTIGFYFTFLVPLTAFITAAGALRDEMKPASVDYALMRPVPRPVFVGFKYLAHVATAQIDYLFGFAAITAVGLWRGVPDLAAALPLLFLAQVLLVFGFSGFGFLCGAVTSRYAVLGLTYGSVVEVGLGQIPTQVSRISMIHQIKAMLQSLAAGSDSSFALSLRSLSPAGPLATAGVLLTFSIVTVALAALVFSARELPGHNEP